MVLFPKWTNRITFYLLLGLFISLGFVVFVFWYWFSPKHLDVGYAPEQPINYSHALHVGQLGLDCRYCHNKVETSAHVNIPNAYNCIYCHKIVRKGSREGSEKEIAKIIDYYTQGKPIPWVKVSFLPDYVYFSHNVHVKAGVSCVVCHGRVDQMERVYQAKPFSMSWCLDCHRHPEKHLRPQEFITKMDWQTDDPVALGSMLRAKNNINPKESCSTCHR